MNRTLSFTAMCLAVACCATSANAGSITPAAFVTPIVDDFTGLGLPTTNTGPLVRPEGAFTFTPVTFRYVNLGGTPFFGEAIGTDLQTGSIDLALNAPTPRVGVYLGASDGTVTFFDPSNALLGTLNYSGGGLNFYGWEDTTNLIARMVVTDTDAQDGAVTFADRVTTESVPEPAALGMVSFVIVAALARRRRASR